MDQIEKAFDDACSHKKEKTMKQYEGQAFFKVMPNVNSPIECVMILKKLNDAIELMYQLQDDHYTDWIFNSSTIMDAWMQQFKPWFEKTVEKLQKLRAMMYGDNIDWNELYKRMYDEALAYEVYWHRFYEDNCKKAYRQKERLHDLLMQNGITKDKHGKSV